MFTQTAHVIHAAGLPDGDLQPSPLGDHQLVEGNPEVRSLGVHDEPGLAIGIWQHAAGISRDVEADEAFVVLSGRATIEVEGGPTMQVGPGDLGLLPAGARTTWTVHETLRKVYVIRSEA